MREVPRPPGGRVFMPVTLRFLVGVVPPRPGASSGVAGVTDREDTEAAVQIDRHRTEIIARGAGFPVRLRIVLDPLVQERKDVLTGVVGMGEEDGVVYPWNLKSQPLAVEPERVG